MKKNIIITMLIALLVFVATSCDSLLQTEEPTNETTNVIVSIDFNTISITGELTVKLFDNNTKSEIASKTTHYTGADTKINIAFERLTIVGKNVYATANIEASGTVYAGTSEVKQMGEAGNSLLVALIEEGGTDEGGDTGGDGDTTTPELEKVDAPIFLDEDGSLVKDGSMLQLISIEDNVTIYYTNDPSKTTTTDPELEGWEVYTSGTSAVSFNGANSVTYRAIAVKEGMANSDIVTVTYTNGKVYYVSSDSNASDSIGDGSKDYPYETVQKAVDSIIADANGVDDTTQYFINIKGHITEEETSANSYGMVEIESDTELHITLQGWDNTSIDNKIDALGTKRVLYISGEGADITLGSNLTLTGGAESSRGGGVYVGYGTFTMDGGKIIGNIAEGSDTEGGGVYLGYGSRFFMKGGEISNNRAIGRKSTGGGLYVAHGAFASLEGGSIIRNIVGGVNVHDYSGYRKSNGYGGGVYANKSTTVSIKGDVIIAENLEMGEETSYDTNKGSPENFALAFYTYGGINPPRVYISDSLGPNANIGITISQDEISFSSFRDLTAAIVSSHNMAFYGGDPTFDYFKPEPSTTYQITEADLSKISFDDKFNESDYLKLEIDGNDILYKAAQP